MLEQTARRRSAGVSLRAPLTSAVAANKRRVEGRATEPGISLKSARSATGVSVLSQSAAERALDDPGPVGDLGASPRPNLTLHGHGLADPSAVVGISGVWHAGRMVARAASLATAALLVLAGCTGDEVADRGCEDGADGPGGVVGFDVDSGDQRWSLPVGSPDGAAVFDQVAVVSSIERVVRGVSIDTGAIVWCLELDPGIGEFVGGIAAAGPIVGALAGDSVVGLDPATGGERWRRELDSSEATLRGGELLWVLDGSVLDTPIMVLDPTTGDDVSSVDQIASDAVSFGIGVPPTVADGLELSTASGGSARQTITVSVSRYDSVVWEDSVPGFVAVLVAGADGPIVAVLDQTGGTGELSGSAETILSAYAATSGDPLWQHELPGTPHLIAQISADLIAVPVGTDVHAISAATGAETWVAELPSPGQGSSYDQAGTFWFIETGTSDTAVAVARAEQPYRD